MRPNLRLQVGEHLIDIGARRVLTRPDLPRMGSRAMGVLIELVRHCGATVPRNQLRQCVWRNKNVTRDIMINSICELRRFFRDDVKVPKYIESVRHSGYRLIAPSALFFAEPVNDALPRVFDSAIATRIAMNIPMQ